MSKWKKVKLGDVCSLYQPKTIPTKELKDDMPYYVYGANGIIGKYHSYNHIDSEIAIACRGTCGAVNITLPKSWITGNAMVAHIESNELSFKYLFYVLSNANMKNVITGAAQPQITRSNLKDLEIPLPPMEEQRKIAQRLDAVSDLLAKQKQLLAEQDSLIQSLFYDMFGDPIKNNKGWKIEKFKKLGTLERGKSQHRPRNAPELLGGPYPLIQTGDIAQAGLYLDSFSQTYSELGLKQSRLWKKGTLCITIAANIAKTSILNFDACFPDSVVGFVNNTSCNIMFIQIWMSFLQKILENNAPQAAQKNINLEILGNLDVILPSLELQEKFAAIVEQIESEKSKIKSAIAETQTLFNALMAEYFEE
ncbi:MAG: restriction endonuclease subunit S [Alphaproteobacteria bacterium]